MSYSPQLGMELFMFLDDARAVADRHAEVAMAIERTSSRRRRGGDHHSRAAVKGAARDMID